MSELMTKEKFLELIEKHGKGKFELKNGYIRCYDEFSWQFCPITFLCIELKGFRYHIGSYNSASIDLNIPHEVTNLIVDASDKEQDKVFRPELMKALGLDL
jgi:hypothetical protein